MWCDVMNRLLLKIDCNESCIELNERTIVISGCEKREFLFTKCGKFSDANTTTDCKNNKPKERKQQT
jgi:hypothetical protein